MRSQCYHFRYFNNGYDTKFDDQVSYVDMRLGLFWIVISLVLPNITSAYQILMGTWENLEAVKAFPKLP